MRSGVRELAGFLGLPDRGLEGALDRRVDQHRSGGAQFDWWEIFDHPKIIAVAEALGYPVRWRSSAELNARYGVPRSQRLRRPLRWARAKASERRRRSDGYRRDEPGTAP